MNADKTECMILSSRGTKHHYNTVKISINGKQLENKEKAKILGVTVTSDLSWDDHTNNVINNMKYTFRGFNRSCIYLKEDTRKLLYNAAIASRLNYCDTIWDNCGVRNKNRLQTIQNRCARRIKGAKPGTSAQPIIRNLGWLNLEQKRKLHKCVLMKKIFHGEGPSKLKELFSSYQRERTITTRQGANNDLSVPSISTDYLKRSFYYDVTKMWNALPVELRTIERPDTFKGTLHKFLLNYQ